MLIENNGKNYSELIAELVRTRSAKTYLEIGVAHGANFSVVGCGVAIGVDPTFILQHNVAMGKKAVHLFQSASDEFFASGELQKLAPGGVDFAFLDGLHLFEFLLRDFYNTERCCHENSLIAMHDCMPVNVEMTERTPNPSARTDLEHANWWTGDVWKLIPILKKYRPDLTIKGTTAFPTGLLFATNLDPQSNFLKKNYLSILSEFNDLESNEANIREAYASIDIYDPQEISGLNHSRHFAI